MVCNYSTVSSIGPCCHLAHAEPIYSKAWWYMGTSAWACRAWDGQEGDQGNRDQNVQVLWLQPRAFQATMFRAKSGRKSQPLRMSWLLLVVPTITSGTAVPVSPVPLFPLTSLSHSLDYSLTQSAVLDKVLTVCQAGS